MESAPKRKARGEATREAILDRAVLLAAAEGLEGLTIGRLAADLGMSKSGLFAHFGSKEDLQLATIEAANARFQEEIVACGMAAESGMARLVALTDAFLAYVDRRACTGGCFFASAQADFDGRPGRVRDCLAALAELWIGLLEALIREAQAHGEIDSSADAVQLAFELNAFVQAANARLQLTGDRAALDRARSAVDARLRSVATAAGARRPEEGPPGAK